jgi:TatD DNase family protein
VWIDAHVHLDAPEFEGDRDEVVARAAAAGVTLMISAATSISDAERVVALTRRYLGVRAAVGIHPAHATEADAASLAALERIARSPSVVALGEIGLDYARGAHNRAAQVAAFRAQLRLARRLALPVVVHDREAHEDVEGILQDEGASKVMLHCFSGAPEMAVRCAAAGWMISLAGPVTFQNAADLRETARRVPADRLLIETDAPYLSPVPMRGRRCEPAYLTYTARTVAALREITLESLAGAVGRNAQELFGVSEERAAGGSAEGTAEGSVRHE